MCLTGVEVEVSLWACLCALFPARCAMVLGPELPIRRGVCMCVCVFVCLVMAQKATGHDCALLMEQTDRKSDLHALRLAHTVREISIGSPADFTSLPA